MKMNKSLKMDVLKACAVLSGFNWFKVTTKTANKTEEFFATGIIEQHDGAVIKAERQFSTPVYLAGFLSVTAEAGNRFVFDMIGGSSATVEGLKKDFADPDQHFKGFHGIAKLLCDLATLKAIVDYERSGKDENGGLLVVLDLRKLGRLEAKNEAQLKKFMNCYCNGQAVKYQTPRTIYFRFNENAKFVGLWDYATEKSMIETPFTVAAFFKDSDTDIFNATMQHETLNKLAQTVEVAI